jgi:pilin isopeptide linkage protein
VTVPAGEVTADNVFGKIKFVKAGTYTFEITEDPGSEEGIDPYDDTTWTLIIEIRDTDNQLVVLSYKYTAGSADSSGTGAEPSEGDEEAPANEAKQADETETGTETGDAGSATTAGDVYEIKDEESSVSLDDDLNVVGELTPAKVGAKFINPYTPVPTHYTPKVTKAVKIDFGPLVAEKIFDFTIELTEQLDYAGTEITGGVLDADGNDYTTDTTTLTIPAGEVTNTALFGEITFVKAGQYTFKITEDGGAEEGIDPYDATEWTLVVVIRDTDNELEVESYTYTPGSASDGGTDSGESGESKAATDETNEAAADETAAEDDLYTVEVDTSTAEFDADTLKIVTAVDETKTGAKFINPYKPEPIGYKPQVTKEMTVFYGPTVAEKVFDFTIELTDQKDAADNAITGGVLDADGNDYTTDTTTLTIPAGETTATALFGEITFVKAGTYTFKVTENSGAEEGVDPYDATEWTLTVVIKDLDGTLEVNSTSYTAGEKTDSKSATFINPYKPAPTTAKIEGDKTIEGEPQYDTVFTFTLTADDEKFPMPAETEKTTTGAGEFTFGPIAYDMAGTYTYKVAEVIGNAVGYEYDTSVYQVTVTVVDLDGELEASVKYELDGETKDKASFVNPFFVGELSITKRVFGEEADTEYPFVFRVWLYDENGDPLQGVYEYSGALEGKVENGYAKFPLKHNQSIRITGIPVGTTWKVEESKYNGYRPTCGKKTGTIQKEASWSNWINYRKPDIPKTGYLSDTTIYTGIALSLLTFVSAAATRLTANKKKRKSARKTEA